jgi:hypothetical protein
MTFVLTNLIRNLFPRPQVVSTLLPLEFVDIVRIPAGKSGLVLATQLTLTRYSVIKAICSALSPVSTL